MQRQYADHHLSTNSTITTLEAVAGELEQALATAVGDVAALSAMPLGLNRAGSMLHLRDRLAHARRLAAEYHSIAGQIAAASGAV